MLVERDRAGAEACEVGVPVSTVNVTAFDSPWLPAVSAWSARAVYVPSVSVPVSTDQLPSPATAGVMSGRAVVPLGEEPTYTRRVTCWTSPATVLAVPAIEGVAVFVRAPFTGV